MHPHPITLQKGMKRFLGHLIVGDDALYFVCNGTSSAWGAAVGGLAGAAIQAMSERKRGGDPGDLTEAELRRTVDEAPGSLVFEAKDIELVAHTLWSRRIKAGGQKYGVPSGFPKPLREELGPWTQRHGVRAKGMG